MLYLDYMIGDIVNLFYPAFCQICSKKTISWNQNLCEDCFKKIQKRLPPFCIKCGRRLAGEPHIHTSCADCMKKNPYFDRALSVFHYNGIMKDVIHNFKYKKIGIPKEFIDATLDFMHAYGLCRDIDIVLSIPMHQLRLFIREINPSHILAKKIAKRLCINHSDCMLKKTKNTPPQSKLTRPERMDNIKCSFSLQKNKTACIRGKNILLVDDIYTTGSTVNECSRILKEARAGKVEVITLARGDMAP